jgi:hypothetical protein
MLLIGCIRSFGSGSRGACMARLGGYVPTGCGFFFIQCSITFRYAEYDSYKTRCSDPESRL